MLDDLDPMAITLVVMAVAIVGTVLGVARRGRAQAAVDRTALPAGADAALWSVTEVLPDPRNHLAIKDPTSELRLTARERLEAAAAPAPQVRPADAARSAQSLAARRAALAKRSAGAASSTSMPGPVAAAAPPAAIDLTTAPADDEPLVIFANEPQVADPRHLSLLPEHLPTPALIAGERAPRWGESPARAS